MSLSRWLPDFGRAPCALPLPIILPNELIYNPTPFCLPLRLELFLCDKQVAEVGNPQVASVAETCLTEVPLVTYACLQLAQPLSPS